MCCEYQLQKPAQCIFICHQGLDKTKVPFDKGKGFTPVPHKSFLSPLSQSCMGEGKKLRSVGGYNVSF